MIRLLTITLPLLSLSIRAGGPCRVMIATIFSRVTPCSVSVSAQAGAAVSSATASTAAELKCFIATPPEVKHDFLLNPRPNYQSKARRKARHGQAAVIEGKFIWLNRTFSIIFSVTQTEGRHYEDELQDCHRTRCRHGAGSRGRPGTSCASQAAWLCRWRNRREQPRGFHKRICPTGGEGAR